MLFKWRLLLCLVLLCLSHSFSPKNHAHRNRCYISCRHMPLNRIFAVNEVKASSIGDQRSYSSKIRQLKLQLAEAGQAGLIAYGLLNMLYYGGVTLIAWIITSEKYASEKALTRLTKVSTTVWIGSQVTKAFRIGGAIFMAPFINKSMDKFQNYFNISSRNKTFAIMTCLIFGSMLIFYAVLLLSASII